MNTTTSSGRAEYRGLLIAGTGVKQITAPAHETWKAIQTSIGAHTFGVVGCQDGIDLYVDDEGLINGSEFNLPLTIIAHTLGAPVALFGNALALSCDDEGNTRALSDEQIQAIIDAVNTTPAPEIAAAVAVTLDVHPAFATIVAQRRAL